MAISIPEALCEYVGTGLCIPWIGAGISVAAGLPTWNGLVESLVARVGPELQSAQQSELQYLTSIGLFEDVVEFGRTHLGEGEYREWLLATLGRGSPTDLHRAIVNLPSPAIVTTNYDQLIETALVSATGAVPTVLTAFDVQPLWTQLARRRRFLLKMHGDVGRPETIVLTSRDYKRHVFGNLSFMSFLQRMLLGHSILFLGSSLSDIYIRRVLEEVTYATEGVGVPHFAVMPNVGTIQRKILRDRFNVRVISYDASKGHVPALLEVLDKVVVGGRAVEREYRTIPPELSQKLSKILAQVFIRQAEARRTCEDLGISVTEINFEMAPLYVWGQVVRLAAREKQLERLLDVLRERAPGAVRAEGVTKLLEDVSKWVQGEGT
ncbi:MAG: SIR2 family protein [Myxococcales bacterium]|nr:SIR2 family protein [Myxococcales bacterium]